MTHQNIQITSTTMMRFSRGLHLIFSTEWVEGQKEACSVAQESFNGCIFSLAGITFVFLNFKVSWKSFSRLCSRNTKLINMIL